MEKMTPNQKAMLYWILERENIRIKKEAGQPKPWSEDKVFQETYFCNIDREDDKVTKWIRENWWYEYSPPNYDFAMIVARIFNLPSTLEAIGQPSGNIVQWSKRAHRVLVDRKADGEKIWNGAYIISTNGKKMDKLTYCFEILDKAYRTFITGDCTTLEDAHAKLMKIEGLASFLSAQVVADLKNSLGHPLASAFDWHSFSAPGPGSLRGLTWFFEEKVTAKNYHELIEKAYDMLWWELPDEVSFKLCMQNLQNCFCEYDKFMRVTNGTGRSKRRYQGA